MTTPISKAQLLGFVLPTHFYEGNDNSQYSITSHLCHNDRTVYVVHSQVVLDYKNKTTLSTAMYSGKPRLRITKVHTSHNASDGFDRLSSHV